MKIRRYIIIALASLVALPALADSNGKNQFNPVQTGVTSLGIAPDARGAAMGDLGVATEPDAYSQYWNPSKYAFAYSSAAVSLSYTPWLRKLVNDIFLANLSGYWKMGGGDNQAVSASLRYFSLGEIQMTDGAGTVVNSVNPYEMAFDLGKLLHGCGSALHLFRPRFLRRIFCRTAERSVGIRCRHLRIPDHIPCGGPQRMPMVMGFQHLQHRF